MTETQRPTQEEREHALEYAERAAFKTWANGDERRLARVTLALAAENKALEGRVQRLLGVINDAYDDTEETYMRMTLSKAIADDAKAAGEPTEALRCVGQLALWCPVHGKGSCPETDQKDDRASRRRAFVRKHAARFFRSYIKAGYATLLSRANAIEQAGLIFDETESE